AGWGRADLAGSDHAEAQDVAVLDRPGADDLGEEAQPDAHQPARLAAAESFPIAPLLIAQRRVADRVEGLVERRQVVAAVVLPAERRAVWKLLLADKVAAPQFRRVDPELARQDVDHAFDEI